MFEYQRQANMQPSNYGRVPTSNVDSAGNPIMPNADVNERKSPNTQSDTAPLFHVSPPFATGTTANKPEAGVESKSSLDNWDDDVRIHHFCFSIVTEVNL